MASHIWQQTRIKIKVPIKRHSENYQITTIVYENSQHHDVGQFEHLDNF